MEIPALFYGRYAEVDAACREVVAGLAGGESWAGAMDDAPIDTQDRPGLLVLNGPSPLLGGTAQFQCYLPHFQIRSAVGQKKLSADVEAEVFAGSLQTAWGVLGLLAPANVMWVYPRERYEPLVAASRRYWDVLDAEGPRYSVGMPTGQLLWSVPTNLKYVLANLGVPPAVLRSPLPPGGLAEVVGMIS